MSPAPENVAADGGTGSATPEGGGESGSLAPGDGTDGGPAPSVGALPDGVSNEDPACIDARALEHLRRENLMFERHVLAHVLCDVKSSCATPGHMVVFRGQAMMMRSYCGMVNCSKEMLHVNSPQFNRRVRVPSNTDGLEFTAFAARYETRAEEMVMSAAVHVGL